MNKIMKVWFPILFTEEDNVLMSTSNSLCDWQHDRMWLFSENMLGEGRTKTTHQCTDWILNMASTVITQNCRNRSKMKIIAKV